MEEGRTRRIQVSVLAAFCLSLISCALLTVTFATVTTLVRDIYNIDVFYVESCSFVFFISYVVLLLPAYYFEDYFGVRKTVLFGCFLMTIGSFLRIGGYSSFWWVFSGTIIASASQPFLMNQITKISADWFEENRRVIATSFSMICFLLGQGASYGLSGLFIKSSHSKSEVGRLMVFNSAFSLFSLIMSYIFVKDKPKVSRNDLIPVRSVKEELILLATNFHFICLMVGSGLHMGIGNYFGIIVEILAKDSGLTAEDASIMGVVTIFTGLVSVFNCSLLSSRYGKYKLFVVLCTGGTLVSYILYYFAIRSGNFNAAVSASFIYGLFLLPVYALPLEQACESTYPVREILSSGLINSFGQLFSLIPLIVSYHFKNRPSVCLQISVFFQLIALISVCFSKEELKRQEAETKLKADLVPSYN